MEFLAPAAAAALVAVPAILILYFLKVRGAEVRVGSLMLWARHLADRQANAPWKRLRMSLLLLVQLLVAIALAFALMRPGVSGAAGVASTTVVLLDGSPSMRATDVGPSRFEAAVSEARDRAGQLGGNKQMAVVVLGAHAQLLAAATSDSGALNDALDKARPGGEAANFEEGISLANAILAGKPGGAVVLYSDGHLRRPDTPPPLSAPLRYQSLGRSGENAAIESVGRTPQGDVFVRVANLGTTPRDLRMEMRADGKLVDVVPVAVEAGSGVEMIWSRLPAGARLLEAKLTPGDDFGVDDAAWLVTDTPVTRRVLLVTKENGFLTKALALRPDLNVTVVDPGAYVPGAYDLSIFDGFIPPGPLPEPALLVNPPKGAGPVPVGDPFEPGGVLPASPREPLLQYVSLRDVHVQTASTVTPPPNWRTVISATNGPLLLVHQGEPRIAQLNFDVHQSDLPLRTAFPILVQNLVSHLMPGGFENQVLPLGQPVRLTAAADATSMEVTTPSGTKVRLKPPFPATLDDTARPGVYQVRETRGDQTTNSQFVVQLQDLDQSRIAPGGPPEVRAVNRAVGKAERGTLEIWPWIAALALVALLAEWVVFHRG